MKTPLLIVLALLITNPSAAHAQRVLYKNYYEGLPDLDRNPPFTAQTPQQAAALRTHIIGYGGAAGVCPGDALPGTLEICGPEAITGRRLLRAMARGLPAGQFSHLWRVDFDESGEPEVLAQYEHKTPGGLDRYAAFFVFQWNGTSYQVRAAHWFLEGSVHAVRSFGPTATKKTFLRYVSCTECTPWVYLIACDLLTGSAGEAFEFSYSPAATDSWDNKIEYELPGQGHSTDAKVETRIPVSPPPGGPHLLQYFDLEDGPDEWWSFACTGWRCTPRVHEGEAPASFVALWKNAKSL